MFGQARAHGRVKGRVKGSAAAAITVLLLLTAGCGAKESASTDVEVARGSDSGADPQMVAAQLQSLGGAADAATRALYSGPFQASGALDPAGGGEGAWEFSLTDDYGVFNRPGLSQDGGVPGERQFRAKGMQVSVGPVTVAIKQEDCPLPNGETLSYSATVLYEGVSYQGCARRGMDISDRATWASALPDLLPAIDACLARANAQPARVTTASVFDENTVSVRIRERDGSRRECLANQDGSSIASYEPVSDIDRRTGEGDPEFLRATPDATAPNVGSGRCMREARDANGALLGWLISSTC